MSLYSIRTIKLASARRLVLFISSLLCGLSLSSCEAVSFGRELYTTSGLLGGHVWCEVRSLVSQQLNALAARHLSSSLTDVWQQLFEQQDITVICTIHFHLWLHENHTSAPAPRDTDWNRYAGTCLSEISEGRQWAEAASDWNVVSNQQSFNDQAADVLMRVSKPKANTEHLL